MLTPMLFEIMEGAACSINEYQIVVAGGVNSQFKCSDILQVYDIRENQWRLYDIYLSTPRRRVTMISTQKDRVMILGGVESDGKVSATVEEIDFIKRNLVALPNLKQSRAGPSAFQVNDAIYVFGGAQTFGKEGAEEDEMIIGEKFAVRENKWREVLSRAANSFAAKQAMQRLMRGGTVFGPVHLLYE